MVRLIALTFLVALSSCTAGAALGTLSGVAAGMLLGGVAASTQHSPDVGAYVGSGALLGAVIGGTAAGVSALASEDSGKAACKEKISDAIELERERAGNRRVLSDIRREQRKHNGIEVQHWQAVPDDAEQ